MTYPSLPPDRDGHGSSPTPRHNEGGTVLAGCALASAIASAFFDVPVAVVTAPNRATAASALARHVAMYLAHVTLQLKPGQVAAGFRRDRTSISYAVQRIEDRRDDPSFDALMERLERLAVACRFFATGEGPGEEEQG